MMQITGQNQNDPSDKAQTRFALFASVMRRSVIEISSGCEDSEPNAAESIAVHRLTLEIFSTRKGFEVTTW